MENKNVIKKSILYFIGNFSSKILTSILVPIYAFYVNAATLGNYDYFQTIINIAVPILFVSIWEAILRFLLTEKDLKKAESYQATISIFAISVNILLFIMGVFLYVINHDSFYIFIILMINASSFSQIWQAFARAKHHNVSYVLASTCGTLVNLLLNIVCICFLNMQLAGLCYSFIFGQFTIFIILEMKMKLLKNTNIQLFQFKDLFQMLRYSYPLVINSISIWLINGFGRMIINYYLGAEINGLYAFAGKFSNIVSMLGSVLTMALTEESLVSVTADNIHTSFSKTIEDLFRLFLSLIIIAMPMIALFYLILQNTPYADSINLLPFLLLYSIFMNMATNIGIGFKVMDMTRYQFTTTLLGAGITVAISMIGIHSIGIYSVITGQLIGSMVMFFARYWFLKKISKFSLKYGVLTLLFIFYICVSSLCLLKNSMLHIILTICLIPFLLFLNRTFIFSILPSRSKKYK